MSEALTAQKKELLMMIAGLVLIVLLAAGSLLLAGKLRASKKQEAEVSAVLEETIGEMTHAGEEKPRLSDREKEILDLLAKGYTTPQIAEALRLSQETIKWYRKKLLVKFDAANTAELVNQARELGIL